MTGLARTRSAIPPTPMTIEQFLAWYPDDGQIWELIDGVPKLKYQDIEGMASPSQAHGIIANNAGSLISARLRARRAPYRVEQATGVPITAKGNKFRIPDLVVRCGRNAASADAPVLVIEIDSPSTSVDQLEDREADYRLVPEVREILRFSQEQRAAYLLRRNGDLWTKHSVTGAGATLRLDSLDLDLPLDEFYLDVFEDDLPVPAADTTEAETPAAATQA